MCSLAHCKACVGKTMVPLGTHISTSNRCCRQYFKHNSSLEAWHLLQSHIPIPLRWTCLLPSTFCHYQDKRRLACLFNPTVPPEELSFFTQALMKTDIALPLQRQQCVCRLYLDMTRACEGYDLLFKPIRYQRVRF